jgi:hypothetical protein
MEVRAHRQQIGGMTFLPASEALRECHMSKSPGGTSGGQRRS